MIVAAVGLYLLEPYLGERKVAKMNRIIRLAALFLGFSVLGFTLLSVSFRGVCWIGGHSQMEAIWGVTTSVILGLAVGAEALLTWKSRESQLDRPHARHHSGIPWS
ncbi:hypothetical protein [Pararhizobium sp.]|uniref:hypothetical protein n=1 Tax=Pararhizobium sp. TaxID=1977563 RepID=UPI003D0B2908